jgi:hypothetical protein
MQALPKISIDKKLRKPTQEQIALDMVSPSLKPARDVERWPKNGVPSSNEK